MVRKKIEPKEYLFVDAYNIINSWSVFKDRKVNKLEETRNKLIDIMLEYQSYSGIQVIIVFDAHLVKGNNGTQKDINGMKVIYTQEHETADHFIERSITKIGRIKRVRVATSDQLEQQIILSRGATRISARELEMEVFGGKEYIKRNQSKENEKNDYHFGKLDYEVIKALNNIKINDDE